MPKSHKYIKYLVSPIVILLALWLIIFLYIKTIFRAYDNEVKTKIVQIRNSYGINIHYRYSHESFLLNDSLAHASQPWVNHVKTILPLVEEFLSKYPRDIIRKNLSNVFFFGKLEISGKSYGGTYARSAIYITTGGLFRYTDTSLLGLMHAEFSSILFHNYNFPKEEWEAINESNWKYIGSGFEMLGRRGSYDQTDQLLQNGFLDGYSQASLEEDFNKFVDWAFTKSDRLCELVSKFERITKKYLLLVEFYKSIDPRIELPSCNTKNLGLGSITDRGIG